MILGKIFKFYKIKIFSGIAIATLASQLQCPKILKNASGYCNCDAGVAIESPTRLLIAGVQVVFFCFFIFTIFCIFWPFAFYSILHFCTNSWGPILFFILYFCMLLRFFIVAFFSFFKYQHFLFLYFCTFLFCTFVFLYFLYFCTLSFG